MKFKKNTLSLIMAVVMILSAFPFSAKGAGGWANAGSGDVLKPDGIPTLSFSSVPQKGQQFILTADIVDHSNSASRGFRVRTSGGKTGMLDANYYPFSNSVGGNEDDFIANAVINPSGIDLSKLVAGAAGNSNAFTDYAVKIAQQSVSEKNNGNTLTVSANDAYMIVYCAHIFVTNNFSVLEGDGPVQINGGYLDAPSITTYSKYHWWEATDRYDYSRFGSQPSEGSWSYWGGRLVSFIGNKPARNVANTWRWPELHAQLDAGQAGKALVTILDVNETTKEALALIVLPSSKATGQSGATLMRLSWDLDKGDMHLKKSSAKTAVTNGNSSYSMAGIQYTVYTDNACTTIAKDVNGNNAVFTLDANGEGGTITMQAGTYYVKETYVPATSGYLPDSTPKQVTVSKGQTAEVSFLNEPLGDPIGILLKKIDATTGKPVAQGSASLAGAEYTVKYYQNQNAEGEAYRTWVFKTNGAGEIRLSNADAHIVSGDALFYNQFGKTMIPVGSITIQETKAPTGYKTNPDIYTVKFTLQPDGTVRSDKGVWNTANEMEDLSIVSAEQLVHAGLEIKKESDGPIGNNSLADIRFAVVNKSTGSVTVAGVEYAPGTVVEILTTDAAGKAQSATKEYAVGSYLAIELRKSATVKVGDTWSDALQGTSPYANASFLWKSNELPITITDSDEGKYVAAGYAAVNSPLKMATDVLDAKTDTRLVLADAGAKIIDTITYENLPDNGKFRVKEMLKDAETGNVLASVELVLGISWSATEFKKESYGLSGPRSGSFEMTPFEIDLSKYAGKTLVVTAAVYDYDTGEEILVHDDLKNTRQTVYIPKVGTTATANGAKIVKPQGTVTIKDTVKYENLIPGMTYIVSGSLYDKTTGKFIVTNVTKDFVPATANGTIEMKFSVDATPLAGHTLVVFEKLYVETISEDKLVGKHEDPNDEGQSIRFPEVSTELKDAGSKEHISLARVNLVLVDTVSYKNLIPGKEYTVKGVLMDKETGKELLIGGKTVTAETSFTPDTESGTVDLSFEFNGIEIAGKTIVAFETVYHEGVEIAVHADLNDEDQTVRVPSAKTNASGSNGNKEIKAEENVIIKDKISYTNFVAGKEYTVKGILMNKKTGKPVVGADGKDVAVEYKFTPKEANGVIEITFKVDTRSMKGHSLVVFEKIYDEKGNLIAEHCDINDAAQTVRIPLDVPNTGDTADLMLPAIAFVGSGVIASVILIANRKKRRSEEK